MADLVDPLDAAFTTPDGGTAPEGGQGQPADDTTSAVQPEGQGQPDASTGLYDLSAVPEQYRSEVERIAKDIDRNVNSKLQEYADHRKQWEPFQELGLQDFDPEGVGALLQFATRLSEGGDTAREALSNLAASLEIDLGQAPAADAGEPSEDTPLTRAEFEAWKQAQDEARLEAQYAQEAEAGFREEYAEILKANGKPFTPEENQRLLDLARRFQADHDQPIKAAYELINSIAGGAEAALVNGQPTPPAPAEPGGRAATTVQPVDTFEEAERLMRERRASVNA